MANKFFMALAGHCSRRIIPGRFNGSQAVSFQSTQPEGTPQQGGQIHSIHYTDRVNKELRAIADALPGKPGVYLFKDGQGTPLYIGKADNLHARVRQYLQGGDGRFMIPFLVEEAQDIEVILTASTKEALLLERSLIKRRLPRYNVQLRDDTNWLHLRLNTRSPWPRYTLVRRTKKDKAVYFGPFHSAAKARSTLAFLQRVFPLRTCTDAVLKSRTRPCLLFQMGRCCAPCVDHVTPSRYAQLVEQSTLLLKGRHTEVMHTLRENMLSASEREEYEEAARIRDLISDISTTLEQQRVIDPKRADRDVWAAYRCGLDGAVALVTYREGVMSEPVVRHIKQAAGNDGEWMAAALIAHYEQALFIPPEVLVSHIPDAIEDLTEWLSERATHKVRILAPLRGKRHRWVGLAAENARLRFNQNSEEQEKRTSALEELGKLLHLEMTPYRIECFDNSNLQGTHPVAAMAVFIEGRPKRSEYRRYRIKTVIGADDTASMKEIITRRMRRAVESGAYPDLIVVDGGKGQVSAAQEALHALGLEGQALIGLSKPRSERRKGDRLTPDKIVLPHADAPLILSPHSPVLRMLQYLRDETHNHAIRYHRKVRRKDTVLSVLEAIPGVGPSRCKALLRTLGSATAVANSDAKTLSQVPGIGPVLARQIIETLQLAHRNPEDS